jgi:two-component system nitrogen regulation sensor histidine kinase NtrY
MASRGFAASRFSAGLVARASAFAALAFVAVQLALVQHLYATAVVLAGLAGLAFLSLWRAVTQADRMFARFVEGVTAGEVDRAARTTGGLRRFADAIDRASETFRVQRVEQQRRIEALLTLVDSVPAALMVVDRGGRIVLSNRAARQLAGEDVAYLGDIAALGADAAARLQALSAGGREIVRLADGRLALAAALGFVAPGMEAQRLLSLQDVAAQLDAVELKAWQDLVRVLAHEMLNSLTPIVSLAESLQSRPHHKADVDEAIEVIARRSRGLMSFVDRYRKVAEIPRPTLGAVDLDALVGELSRLMAPLLAERALALETQVDPVGLTVSADRDLLEQAMINLLKNAIDAVAGVEQPTISLVCRINEGWVEISVIDNGPGIAAEDADKVFIPFFTTKVGGSGIGLSVARQIALAHHGRLDSSQPTPSGARFTLSLPA